MRRRGDFWRRFRRHRSGMVGLVTLAVVVALAVTAPLLFPGDPFRKVDRPFAPPFGIHLLGTDVLGRDVAAGVAHGARTSLLIGGLATSIAVLVGSVVGGVAGYYGGWVDDALMRVTEFFQTIPTFLFAIVLLAILSPSLKTIVFAIAVVTWPPVARLARGEVLSMRAREFVQACVALGMPDRRVLVRHVLPNCLSPIVVTGSLTVATAILIESALSFLGLGDPIQKSWGSVLYYAQARSAFLSGAWVWWVIPPGVAITMTVLGLAFIAFSLERLANPRLFRR
jgi:peptide/nickel transport system permease protein